MKKVDLTQIVGSRILCEFLSYKDGISDCLGFLDDVNDDKSIQGVYGCTENTDIYFDECRIYQHPSHWIPCVDKKLVIPNGLWVMAFYVSLEGEYYVVDGEVMDGVFSCNGADYRICECQRLQIKRPSEGWSW